MATLARHWEVPQRDNVHRVLIDVGLVKQECELRIELKHVDELLRGHNWKGHNGTGGKKERRKEEVKPERLDRGLEGHSTHLGRGTRTCPKVPPVPSPITTLLSET